MPPALSFGDLTTAAQLMSLALLVRFGSEPLQERVASSFARLHLALRGSRVRGSTSRVSAPGVDLDLRDLEKKILTTVYEDMLHTLREYRREGWNPEIHIEGAHHVEEALSRKHGAVLWSFSSTVGGLVGRKALRSAGFDVTLLSSDIHPYSASRFGRRFLNPVRTKVENRYIAERVTLHPDSAAVAVWRLTQLVRENKLVEIAATGTGESPASFPFLGGTLTLALGAPMVATMGRSALIPVFSIPVGDERYEVHFEKPLEDSPEAAPRENAVHLARQYAGILEKYVTRAPQVWRGWFAKTNWQPSRESAEELVAS